MDRKLLFGSSARVGFAAAFALAFIACNGSEEAETAPPEKAPFVLGAGKPYTAIPEEVHLTNVRQLTFDGENAEAYFAFDGTKLAFQRKAPTGGCDQIYSLDLATGDTARISSGEGRTTCAYFYPSGDKILYSSTHLAGATCPPEPDFSRGYVWAIYPSYDIFVADLKGGPLTRLTETPGYDAEATISPKGDRIVFTSMRSGDLDLWTMRPDGTDLKQITTGIGYDGGAFFSPDGSKIVWRAHYPKAGAEQQDYVSLRDDGLIRPTTLEIYVANADGTDVHQLTSNGKANFAPFFHPSGQKVLWASNMDDPAGRDFDIYAINLDGTGQERITFTKDFDGFPMFSPDGKYLVWGSNRNPSHEANTNVFIAEWKETP